MENQDKYTNTPYMISGSSEPLRHLSYAEEQLEHYKRKDERCETCKYVRKMMKLNNEWTYCCTIYVDNNEEANLFEVLLGDRCEMYEELGK